MALVPEFDFLSDALTASTEGVRTVKLKKAYKDLGLKILREKHLVDAGVHEMITCEGFGTTGWAFD